MQDPFEKRSRSAEKEQALAPPALPDASEDDWRRREEVRKKAVDMIKKFPEYQWYADSKPREEREAGAPTTPDPRDRTISKRKWKYLTTSWRLALKQRYTDARRKELHDCMCTALELDADQIKTDSDALKAQAAGMSEADFLGLPELKALAGQKYSYPIGAGLLTLMPVVDGGATPTAPRIERWATAFGVSEVRLSKDWMFFEKALKSMADARTMMIEMQAAAKRKEAKALAEKADKAAKAAEAAQA